ncbi:putative membrane protein YttA [Bacillus subtilis]|nr:putative membrane protein YttA [Bacillus subtilis]
MEMVLAFLGFLACLIALGYGLYHFVRYVLKKEKRFSKRLFWPLFIAGPCAALYRGSIGRT